MGSSFSLDARRLVNDLGGASALYEKIRVKFPEAKLKSVKTIEKWVERRRMTLENFMRCKQIAADMEKKILLDDYMDAKPKG